MRVVEVVIGKILELYSRYGESLLNCGVNDAVLPLNVANEDLGLFAEAKWIVLGGDVYLYGKNEIRNFYADWYGNFTSSSESCYYAKEHLIKLSNENIYVSFIIKN